MIILASDTSGTSISVALCRSGQILDEILEKTRMQHASRLQPAVNEILERNRLSLQDIDLFATTTGPGSFTGIRIGLAAVMGMAYGTGKEVFGISSLAALAAAVSPEYSVVAPVLDARGGRVYSGVYQNGSSLIAESPREIVTFLELLAAKYSRGEEIIFVGDGSPLIKDHIESPEQSDPLAVSAQRFTFAPGEKNDIRASEVALLAHAAYERGENFLAPHEIRATYGIESAAKRNLNKNKGNKRCLS
ncbi:MAG: tRNA (adenosine(37)-N6)-threonylcarbamoyltransferase complex dimerization subunit type 1 TsaB [Eubacteriales bacterium]|nr:tRNA (adenosine(37)-N6)-threonylcarbamoyltransferase complex dimerization subunit type 1 TsaB [Eubacteriales bacterium]MDD4324201.1 tRNA (adenosine(37)-N6)-threonylcarbamoyltransferase complex dimerization subunit type 1 TsaB [Eubacteriales bacterium]MDD4541269.1 tRNA (adenosine(37)-N6)-threonylcarbamoyltransferase complex dimerization subunit type 1 TsaB [Eubacteriales bacterium]